MTTLHSTTTPVASSPRVLTKAAVLAARYDEQGFFTVSSGSEPGKVYTVAMAHKGAHPRTWACGCAFSQFGGAMCSHVRAAQLEAERICKQRGIIPAWAPKPMLPAPEQAEPLPEMPETVECPKCRGRGGECERCQGEGEVSPWCGNCELPSDFDPPLAVVRVRDWQGREENVCASCLAAIEADPDGHGNSIVVAVMGEAF